MCNLNLSLNIINISFTIINVILSFILIFQKKAFDNATKTTLVRYRYFEYVLLVPYFKLIMTSLLYDILNYSVRFFLKKFYTNIKSDKNEENIRTKSIRENMVSNLMLEFLFMSMIKGLALGFGVFYVIELDKEIKRIIKLRDINNNQEKTLKGMASVVTISGFFDFITIIFQIIFFMINLCKSCKGKKSYFNNENKINQLQKRGTKKGLKKVDSTGNISLPETRGDDFIYEKLDQ